MIINSYDEDVGVQVRGRYRDDLDLCYYYANMKVKAQKPLIKYAKVPQHFLDRRLYKNDTQNLCNEINYRKNGRRCYFPTVQKMLLETGEYDISHGRDQKGKKSREYYVITLKA
jgi:hypothetical protein